MEGEEQISGFHCFATSDFLGSETRERENCDLVMGSLREDEDEHSLKETELKLGLPGGTERSEHRLGKRTFSEAFTESGNDERWVSSPSVLKSVTALETSKPNEQGMLSTPLPQKMMQRSLPPLSWKASVQIDPSEVSVSAEEKHLGDSAIASEMPPPKAQVIGWPPVRSFRRNTLAFNSKTTEEGSSDSYDMYAKATVQTQTIPDTIMQASAPAMAPAPKAQVVGWPPVRSFRKNTLAANSTPADNGSSSGNTLYVKVSMDGAPYLRKVDLKMYSTYQDLSSALEKMFCCFSMGKCRSNGLNENKLMDLLNGSEYVPTYEDKEGDWMLIGDVPWEMFVDSCKRMRITKVSEAVGLAPRVMEKCKNRI